MKKKIMKKKILVAGMALAALLAMPQMTASASGTVQTMEVVEAIPTETGEIIESIREIDIAQDMEADTGESTLSEKFLLDVNAAGGIIASGQSGNITWVIDGNGKLTVEGTGDLVGSHLSGNWMPYEEQIISAEINVSGMTDASYLFRDCCNLTSVDVSGFDTRNVTNMHAMFYGCSSLTGLDVSGFDTSKVRDMGAMFYDCRSLTGLNVSGFDTRNVTDMGFMFSDCSSLTSLDVSRFDTDKVTDMDAMFQMCSGLTSLDVSKFNTRNVTNMGFMFSGCSSLTSLDVSGFDTGNVTRTWYMFWACRRLKSLDLSNFDLSSVKMIEYLDGSKGNGAESMFGVCNELITIKTFKAVPKEAICDLPAYYVDETGNRTNEITAAFVGKTLTREGADIPLPTPVNPPSGETTQKVQSFVSRMYTVALGRNAEEAGLNDWTNRLLSHEIDGAGIANGFIMSEEFKNRNLSNEDFVDTLYHTFFDREADQGGRATWLAELAAGKSRSYVLAGFVNSTEFDNLCDAYGIVRGTMREDGVPTNPGIRSFVERCYTKVLGRAGEKAGVEDWTSRISTGAMSAEDVAKSFFFSEEYTNKNTDNETFVETLYQTFMDRASDPAGKSDWVGRLGAGVSREEVLKGFSRSEEFAGILRSYGL